jgi:hypothetical protein
MKRKSARGKDSTGASNRREVVATEGNPGKKQLRKPRLPSRSSREEPMDLALSTYGAANTAPQVLIYFFLLSAFSCFTLSHYLTISLSHYLSRSSLSDISEAPFTLAILCSHPNLKNISFLPAALAYLQATLEFFLTVDWHNLS